MFATMATSGQGPTDHHSHLEHSNLGLAFAIPTSPLTDSALADRK